MHSAAIKLEMVEETEDRYSRLRLIPWWDQEKLRSARVLVVGAGALGNEILKNLALLGVLHLVVVDLDRIELSNLSRAILFRPGDVGSYKAAAVARAYRDLLPEAEVQPLAANVMQDCGLGLFAWADLILAGWTIERRASDQPVCLEGPTPLDRWRHRRAEWRVPRVSSWQSPLLRVHAGRNRLGPAAEKNVVQSSAPRAANAGTSSHHTHRVIDHCRP